MHIILLGKHVGKRHLGKPSRKWDKNMVDRK
jgi:hypothetical protein